MSLMVFLIRVSSSSHLGLFIRHVILIGLPETSLLSSRACTHHTRRQQDSQCIVTVHFSSVQLLGRSDPVNTLCLCDRIRQSALHRSPTTHLLQYMKRVSSGTTTQPGHGGIFEAAYNRITSAWLNSANRAGCMDVRVVGDDPGTEVSDDEHGTLKMNNGHLIPIIGLGVYQCHPGEEAYDAVRSALSIGYRHIDTAEAYRNEEDVGRAIRDCGIPRSSIFVTSKLKLSCWGKAKAAAAVESSLKKLGLDYIDLFLLHAPGDPALRSETWAVLEHYHALGRLRSIGVSNFGISHLEKLTLSSQITPAVNQIELHPFLQWRELVAFCQKKGILLEAYSPLARGQKLDDPTIGAISSQLGVTPAQIMIRWSIQKGYITLPKSVMPERQRENIDVFSFTLPEDIMAKLDALECDFVTGWDPIRDHEV